MDDTDGVLGLAVHPEKEKKKSKLCLVAQK